MKNQCIYKKLGQFFCERSSLTKMLSKYTNDQLQLVANHVKKRLESKKISPRLNIVYDILYECNLCCKGCGVSSKYVNRSVPLEMSNLNPTTEDIFVVLEKIKKYVIKHDKDCFINFGGGEPFLRPDLKNIIQKTYSLFGSKCIGIDTNGTVDYEFERIQELAFCFSYLGISLDGLEEYHNWWRGCDLSKNAFQKTVSLIKNIVKDGYLNSLLEVSSVATKKNINQIPDLIDFLHNLGVKKYSIHRAMQVGRMEYFSDIVPNAEEYFDLLVKIVERANRYNMSIHLHHSIESIYATLLLGLNTYISSKVGNPDIGSSLGIDPRGIVVFDPWCVSGIWQKLRSHSLLEKDITLEDVLDLSNGTILDLTKLYSSSEVRCNGCQYPCSGGSRIAAAVNKLTKQYKKFSTLTESHLLGGMTDVDPACPLYEKGK